MEVKKVTLDWKAPSEKKIHDFIEQFGEDKMYDFAMECILEDDNGNEKMNRAKAKDWLVKEFDKTDYIEWKNRPKKKDKEPSAVKKMAAWKNLKK